ncbi:MAG: Uncharacterised protein [Gammaproteobacteria bacterium]|nr:MAG: Uncharacterised protein [Gammaproteobacteria bacterium]
MKKLITSAFLAGFVTAGASAAVIEVTSDITSDTTWTSANDYILTDIIYVKNGATLTINPGTIIRGEPEDGSAPYNPGALVVTRNGQIDAEGTPSNPIVFTTALLDSDGDGQYSDETYDYNTLIDYDAAIAAGAAFLDDDPIGDPLSPGSGYLSGTPGDQSHVGADEYRGLWGGVIILGNAPTNIMDITNGKLGKTTETARDDLDDVFEGFIEGLDPDDTGTNDGVYGGSNPNDSSGTFKYVGIRHGGVNIAADNEINGLTMGGVGFGTLIEYVEVYCNDDDGFEWFGGTANCRYLISLYNNDDSFDIDEGFTGLGQFWFSLQIDDNANGDHGGEHDGTNGAFDNVDVESLNGHILSGAGDDGTSGTGDSGFGIPVTYPTIYNATYLGAGTSEQMLKFEDSFGCNYYNSIFVGAEKEFIDADNSFVKDGSNVSNNMQDRITAGDCDFVSNSVVYNINGETGALASTDISNNPSLATIIAANNNVLGGTNPFSTLTSSTVRANVDPRATGATPGGVDLAARTATFFITAGYAGAFNPQESDYWSDGWSVFDSKYALASGSR